MKNSTRIKKKKQQTTMNGVGLREYSKFCLYFGTLEPSYLNLPRGGRGAISPILENTVLRQQRRPERVYDGHGLRHRGERKQGRLKTTSKSMPVDYQTLQRCNHSKHDRTHGNQNGHFNVTNYIMSSHESFWLNTITLFAR